VVAKEDPSVGATTDFDGKFTLETKPEWTALIFSYLGYDKQEVTISDQTTLNVALGTSSYNLDQIVVSASKKKENARRRYNVNRLSWSQCKPARI